MKNSFAKGTLRRILSSAAPVAVLLLAWLSQNSFLGEKIVTGYDTQLTIAPVDSSSGGRSTILRHGADKGLIECRLELLIELDTAMHSEIVAYLEAGSGRQDTLKTTWGRFSGLCRWLRVSDTASSGEIKWSSFDNLTLDCGDTACRIMSIHDWQIESGSGKWIDSREQAWWRRFLAVSCLALMAVIIICTILTNISSKSDRAVSDYEDSIHMLINAIEGEDGRKTEQMRALLIEILVRGTPLTKAVSKIPGTYSSRLPLMKDTTQKFMEILLDYMSFLMEKYEALEGVSKELE